MMSQDLGKVELVRENDVHELLLGYLWMQAATPLIHPDIVQGLSYS